MVMGEPLWTLVALLVAQVPGGGVPGVPVTPGVRPGIQPGQPGIPGQPAFPPGTPGVQPGFLPGAPGRVPGLPPGGFLPVQPGNPLAPQPGVPIPQPNNISGFQPGLGGVAPGGGVLVPGGVVPVVPGVPGGVVEPGAQPGVVPPPRQRPRVRADPAATVDGTANSTQPMDLPAPVTTAVTPGVQNTAAMVGGVLVTEDQIRVADDPLFFGSFRRGGIPTPDPRIRTVSRRDRSATVELTTRIGYQPGAAAVNGGGQPAPAGGAVGRSSDVQQLQPGK